MEAGPVSKTDVPQEPEAPVFLSRAVNISMCSMCVIVRHGESTCRFVGLSVSWLKFEALCCIIPRDKSSTSTLFL